MPSGAWALLGELLWLSLGRELSLGQLSLCWGREGGRGSLPPPTLHPGLPYPLPSPGFPPLPLRQRMSLSCQLQGEHKALLGTTLSPVSPASSEVLVCLAPAAAPPPHLLGFGIQEPSDLFIENCGSQAGVNGN